MTFLDPSSESNAHYLNFQQGTEAVLTGYSFSYQGLLEKPIEIGPKAVLSNELCYLDKDRKLQIGLPTNLEIDLFQDVHFDMDGVLVDTERDRQDALEEVGKLDKNDILNLIFPKHEISLAQLATMSTEEVANLLDIEIVKNKDELLKAAGQLHDLADSGLVGFFGGKQKYETYLQDFKDRDLRPFAGVVGKSLDDHAKVFSGVASACSGHFVSKEIFPTEIFRYVRNLLVQNKINDPKFAAKEGVPEIFRYLSGQIVSGAIVTQTDRKHTLQTLKSAFKLGIDPEMTALLGENLERITLVTFDDVSEAGLRKKPHNDPHRFAGAQNALKTLRNNGIRQFFSDQKLSDADLKFCAEVARIDYFGNLQPVIKLASQYMSESEAIKFARYLPALESSMTAEDTNTGHLAAIGTVFCPDNRASISDEDRTLISGKANLINKEARTSAEDHWKLYEFRMLERKPNFKVDFAGDSMLGMLEILRRSFQPSYSNQTYTSDYEKPMLNISLSTKLREFASENPNTITLRFDT